MAVDRFDISPDDADNPEDSTSLQTAVSWARLLDSELRDLKAKFDAYDGAWAAAAADFGILFNESANAAKAEAVAGDIDAILTALDAINDWEEFQTNPGW
jgi:hypothetical protein